MTERKNRKGPGSAPGPYPVLSQRGASSDSAACPVAGASDSRSLRSSLRTTSARIDHDVIFVVFDFLPLLFGLVDRADERAFDEHVPPFLMLRAT